MVRRFHQRQAAWITSKSRPERTSSTATVRGHQLAQIEGGVTEDGLRLKRGSGVNRLNRTRFVAGGAIGRTARIVCRARFTGCDPEV